MVDMTSITRLAIAVALLGAFASPAAAKPPREQSPAPRELLDSVGQGSSDAEIAAVAAAAAQFPLGTRENPVRVGGPEGERAYLGRLRCANGSTPKVGPRMEAGVGAYGSIVGAYALDCGAAAPGRTNLVMDRYHEDHVEAGAPAGFTLAR